MLSTVRIALSAVVAAALGVSCGGGDRLTTDGSVGPPADPGVVTASSPTNVVAPVVAAASPVHAARVAQLEQPAVWPAPDVVFETPEEAAADFVAGLFGSPPELTLSDYRSGDSRSGEIDVVFFSAGELTSPQVTSTLLMRQLGPDSGWFVLAAVSDRVAIDTPASGATVAPGPVNVSGTGQGQEGTINVSAFPAGEADMVLDATFTQGGLFEPAPYETVLDLASAPAGSTAIWATGASGLSELAQNFTLIPVDIGLPGTR